MRKTAIAAIGVLLALCAAAVAQAKNVPPTQVPTAPSISGAVYTTVNLYDPNYASECHNGNPAVNCNQYTGKQFVYLNGGPTHNQLSPDGVYFFAVLAPSGQANPSDGVAQNLSYPYDCYQNREIWISGGEVKGVIHSTDPSCFHNTSVLPVGTPHFMASGAQGNFVQLFPYADTPNPGGVYIMAVCWVGASATLPAAPLTLANPTNVDPSTCKYDAFKVQFDDVPPTCKLFQIINGPPKQIEVVVQDAGAGLLSVQYSGTNLASVTFPNPLVVGQTDPFYLFATKDDQTLGSTFALTITDAGGNVTNCDPAFGLPLHVRAASVRAGHRAVIGGVTGDEARLALTNPSRTVRSAVVRINGHRFATIALGSKRLAHLDLTAGLRAHRKNVVSVSAAGPVGKLLIRISN
jgi:hypothetical protein